MKGSSHSKALPAAATSLHKQLVKTVIAYGLDVPREQPQFTLLYVYCVTHNDHTVIIAITIHGVGWMSHTAQEWIERRGTAGRAHTLNASSRTPSVPENDS